VTWLPEIVVGVPAPAAVPSGPPALDVLAGLALLVAGCVGVGAGVRLGSGLVRLRRVARSLPPAPVHVQRQLDAVCGRLGLDRPVAAVTAPPGTAPFTLGWRRPVVAVPPGLEGDALGAALVHEAAHVRRADVAWHVAERVLSVPFTAHPLVGALRQGLALDRERAADAAVLDACPGQRRTYADLLLSYASLPAPPLALSAARGSSVLQRRIDAMTRPLPPSRRRQLARRARLAGLALVVLAASGAASSVPSHPDANPASTVTADTTAATIERVEVRKPDGAPAEIHVYLKPGYGRTDAEAVLADVGKEPGDDLLAVHYEGGTVERRVQMGTGAVVSVRGADPSTTIPLAPPTPGVPIEVAGASLIERVDVRRQSEAATVTIHLTPEATLPDAERIADETAQRPGLDRVVVRLADGRTVERSGTRTGSLAPRDTTDEVFDVAEVQPELIGGLEALQEALVYPEAAKEAGAGGRAVVQFIVGTDGGVEEAEVVRSTGNAELDEAALTAVRGVEFTPGVQRGRVVRVRFALPITFGLPSGSYVVIGESEEPARPTGGDEIFEVAEVQPELIGGLEGVQERLVYPSDARAEGVQGRVVVQFVVDEEGRVTDPVVARSPDERLSEAALAAVRGAEFTPGMQRGQPVKVRFALPITFQLPSDAGSDG
jgi:TonB family protein